MAMIIATPPKMQFVYNDKLRSLLELGQAGVLRASHVEPQGINWIADLSPVNGPVLGPFELRQDALDAEVAWLTERLGSLQCQISHSPSN